MRQGAGGLKPISILPMAPSNHLPIARSRGARGYTLVEVLVASSILAMGISAACVLSLAMVTQEEMTHRMERATSLHENAARLFQLGLTPADISGASGILPGNDDLTLSYAAASVAVAGVGNLDGQTITATIFTTPKDSLLPSSARGWTAGARRSDSTQERASRTQVLTIYRTALP